MSFPTSGANESAPVRRFNMEPNLFETPAEAQNRHLNEKVDARDVAEMKAQMVVVADGMATQTAYLKSLMKRDNAFSETRGSTFPISSETGLMEVDLLISENKDIYVRKMKMLLEQAQLSKSLKNIMTEDLICCYNVDGVSGKKGLKQYKSFLPALLGKQKNIYY
ncbi:CG42854 [Drosophila busckii]|uniref:CG42854 n=1 Tax=Drosophila busckii TaxID=30019 RepID=A0A0M4E4S0_DROBS|nr:CG42854 [Drosophila busckii]